MKFLKLSGARVMLIAIAAVAASSHAAWAEAKVLVLLCKGTAFCRTCGESEKQKRFDWTYTIDFSASTVDGRPATITQQNIAWQLRGDTVVDNREINRFSKKFHYTGIVLNDGSELYHGDGTCEPQQKQAF